MLKDRGKLALIMVLTSLFSVVDVASRALAPRLRRMKESRWLASLSFELSDGSILMGTGQRLHPIMGSSGAALADAARDLDTMLAPPVVKGGEPPAAVPLLEQLGAFASEFMDNARKLVKSEAPGKDGDDAGDGMIWLSGKKVTKPKDGAKVDAPADNVRAGGGDTADKSRRAMDDLTRRQLEDPNVVKAIDASEIIKGFAEGYKAGLTLIAQHIDEIRTANDTRLAAMEKSLDSALGGIALLCKGNVELSAVVKSMPARPVAPGVIGMIDGKPVLLTDQGDPGRTVIVKSMDVAEKILKGVREHKIDAGILAMYETNPAEALLRIPADVAKSYGIELPGTEIKK